MSTFQELQCTNGVVAVLQVIAPNDANNLWESMLSSKSVDKILGTSLRGETKYLKAPAETYEDVSRWDTKRQVLAIMADLLTYHELRNFIPEVTEYRFKTA